MQLLITKYIEDTKRYLKIKDFDNAIENVKISHYILRLYERDFGKDENMKIALNKIKKAMKKLTLTI